MINNSNFSQVFNISAHCVLMLFFLLFTNLSFAATTTPDLERFQNLIQEIRCVVCQNQTIADSNAPLAADLRKKIYEMIVEKKSNYEIKHYLVKRYGEFILFNPPFNKLTLFLWMFPFLGITTIIAVILRYTVKQS